MTALIFLGLHAASANNEASPTVDEPIIYVFWGQSCPHSQRAMAFISAWRQEDRRLRFKILEVENSSDNAQAHERALARIGILGISVVPMIVVGEDVLIGFEPGERGPATLKGFVAKCRAFGCPDRMHDLMPAGEPALTATLVPPARAVCAGANRIERVGGS